MSKDPFNGAPGVIAYIDKKGNITSQEAYNMDKLVFSQEQIDRCARGIYPLMLEYIQSKKGKTAYAKHLEEKGRKQNDGSNDL